MSTSRGEHVIQAVRPTIEAVARHASVSRQTVSNALNAPERLKPDTLARVLASIAELGYRPSQAARNLRMQSSRLIGFRFNRPSGIGAIAERFLHSLCAVARDRGYGVVAFGADTDDDEITAFGDLMSRGSVDGFVLMGAHRGDERTAWLVSRGARFVTFGRPWDRQQPAHAWVDVDGRLGLRLAVDHLAALGHRRIGFIGWAEGSDLSDDRFRGWVEGAAAHRLPTRGLCGRGSDDLASAEELAGSLLSQRQPPTAFVCVSDTMAMGVMRAIEHRNLRVGQDISVVGFDDCSLAAVVRPGLTSVRQPLTAVAEKAVDHLVGQLDGDPVKPLRLIVAPTLVIRESSAPAA